MSRFARLVNAKFGDDKPNTQSQQSAAIISASLPSPSPNDSPPLDVTPMQDGGPSPQKAVALHRDAPPRSDSPTRNDSPSPDVDLWRGVSEVRSGYIKLFTVITDTVLPHLSAFEQIVYIHLYRLSHGYNKDTCKIGLPRLSERCGVKQTALRETLNKLERKKLIEKVGHNFGKNIVQGTIFRVPLPDGLTRDGSPSRNDSPSSTDSIIDKHNTDTHNTGSVGVRSRFSLQECKKYAESLRADGITNPGGYATKIHRSGEADEFVAAFLTPSEPSLTVDASQCPDCHGTGFYEPGGVGKGVAKCRHERLFKVDDRQTNDTRL